MMGNLKLLCDFVEKYLGMVRFRNDQFAPILGYGDLVQGNVMIKRVYYVEGLNHNLFSVGQFCYVDLEASPSQAWLWHHRLSHLNFETINFLSKNDIVTGLPKLKYVQDQLCSSCEIVRDDENLDKMKENGVEAEYVALSASSAQVLWMRTELKDYAFDYNKIPLYYDSQSSIAISCNPVQTKYQLAKMFTKDLSKERVGYLARRLGMGVRTSAGDEDCGILSVLMTKERVLDVNDVTPIPYLSKIGRLAEDDLGISLRDC
nr:hypothetical protein [Tanacetum cinerariifolium]